MVQKINLILFMLKIMFFLFFTIDFVVKYDVGMFFLSWDVIASHFVAL